MVVERGAFIDEGHDQSHEKTGGQDVPPQLGREGLQELERRHHLFVRYLKTRAIGN